MPSFRNVSTLCLMGRSGVLRIPRGPASRLIRSIEPVQPYLQPVTGAAFARLPAGDRIEMHVESGQLRLGEPVGTAVADQPLWERFWSSPGVVSEESEDRREELDGRLGPADLPALDGTFGYAENMSRG